MLKLTKTTPESNYEIINYSINKSISAQTRVHEIKKMLPDSNFEIHDLIDDSISV